MGNIVFDEKGLVPVVIQDDKDKDVLMVAYMNKESLNKTLKTGKAWFYSRKRKSLWQKGETSGNFLHVKSIFYDCDGDTLLLKVKPQGPACHTGHKSCFYRSLIERQAAKNNNGANLKNIIEELIEVIDSRFIDQPEDSYIAKLFKGGKERILKKVGEEATEVVIASMSDNKDETIYETADLLFHLLIALRFDDISLDDIMTELRRRRK